jgi:type II secretory pathway pseudopilin PulG
MSRNGLKQEAGLSLIELLISMTVILIMMGAATTLFSKAMSVRARESRTTDALTSAYAALNLMSRELSNSGFGLLEPGTTVASNGIIIADSGERQIHVRSNFTNAAAYTDPNAPGQTIDPGEDVTFYFEAPTRSIVRYDPHASPTTSVVVNRISDVRFQYFDYATSGSTGSGPNTTPTSSTARIVITVTVDLDPVPGQPNPQAVTFSTQVNMRNSNYMLQQY